MNLLKAHSFSKYVSSGTVNKLTAVFCVILTFVYVVPRIFPHVHATGITVSNVTFDPSTGAIDFDYSGDSLTGQQNIDISDTGGSTIYWDANKGHCTSSHCFGSLVVSTNSDSSVTSVILQVGVDNSQTLSYPLPLPTSNAPQTPSAVGGWTATGETWTYASATTFTISGVDYTSIYQKGTRIKLTQSSTNKYFVVIDSSYSGGNTTVTIYGGTDYSLANSTISSQYYSYQASPQGYPQWFSDTNIALVADTGYTITSPTYNRRAVSVIGNQVFIHFNASYTAGGSGTWNLFLNVPIAIANGHNADTFGSVYTTDANGGYEGMDIYNSSTQIIIRKYALQNWATSGTIYVGTYITYEL